MAVMDEGKSGTCKVHMSRAAKYSSPNPLPADVQKTSPGEGMKGTMNRTHAEDGRLTGMKKG